MDELPIAAVCAGEDHDGHISAWAGGAAAVCAGDDHDGSISAWTVAAEAGCHGDDGGCNYELAGARSSMGDCIGGAWNFRKRHKPGWCMEEERQGEADNPGPPRPGTGPKHTLTFDKCNNKEEDESTDDGESDCSSLEVLQDDVDADFDPGPHIPWSTSLLPAGTVLFESGNCTSFRAHLEHIATRQHHAAAYQEAKVPAADHERLQITLAKTHRRQVLFTDTCPEHATPAAGLAAVAKQPLQVIKLKPRSQELKDLSCTGRIEITQFCIGAGVEFIHFNVYGWDGAHESHVRQAAPMHFAWP